MHANMIMRTFDFPDQRNGMFSDQTYEKYLHEAMMSTTLQMVQRIRPRKLKEEPSSPLRSVSQVRSRLNASVPRLEGSDNVAVA
jgi:hypothetical protein